jgi:large subunit ribosomal protein L25
MADFTTIEAEARERAGKGAARATRRAGKVPAVVYGAKQAPTLIELDPRAVMREITRGGWRSRLYEIKLAGAETARALIRDVQFHPVSDKPEHVDFQRLAPGERIRVAITVHFLNEATSPGLKRGGVLNVVRHAVDCMCDPDHVPAHLEADLGTLDINDNVRWSDLKGIEGVRPMITDRDFVIATVAAPTKAADAPAAEGAAPAAAAPAKGAAPAKAAPAKAAPAKAAAPAKGAAPAKAAPAKAAAKPAAKK